MSAPSDAPQPPTHPDEVNRLWQHGMHEERLFHDRLNYFSAMQIGLLGVFAIFYHKDAAPAVFIPLTGVAVSFTLLWLWVQIRHWRYCVHVNELIKLAVPEYRRTIAAFAGPGRTDGLSISRPLAFAVPLLFAATWLALCTWMLIRAVS
ncbi:hypothetical protein ETAA8_49450 [Anatilimnocola aggregata]|uniref:DUF2270 domain-containing protein n=1 Tax=Anatilimnocola aggregata TaxID=2528021 RepID=A0A517YHW4_9BACT|nr:hypothetical protein [Anatilimnocola aggregata]QDU29830.1 hypothetical protein ETAA8_49450 [Anatilimnocola aggregata]